MTRDWITELCPEIGDWQVDLIVEHIESCIAAEREACAKVCERLPAQQDIDVRDECAAAIRARGEQKQP